MRIGIGRRRIWLMALAVAVALSLSVVGLPEEVIINPETEIIEDDSSYPLFQQELSENTEDIHQEKFESEPFTDSIQETTDGDNSETDCSEEPFLMNQVETNPIEDTNPVDETNPVENDLTIQTEQSVVCEQVAENEAVEPDKQEPEPTELLEETLIPVIEEECPLLTSVALKQANEDSGTFSVYIPASVEIDRENMKGQFSLTASGIQNENLTVTVRSENNFHLSGSGTVSLEYIMVRDNSTEIDNGGVAASFDSDGSKALMIVLVEDTEQEGVYSDLLTFSVQCDE